MKRILVLALALIVAVGSLAVPVKAVEPMSEIDFLTAMGYDCYRNDEFWQNIITPSAYCNGYTSFKYQWEFISPLSFDRVVFIIDVAKQPDQVILHRGDWSHEATLIASNGSKYQYEVVLSGTARSFRSTAAIEIQNNSDYYGVFNIISCVGYVSDTVSISKVNYFANALMFDNGGADDEGGALPSDTDFRWPFSVGSGNEVNLPIVVDFSGPTGSDFYTLDYGEVFLKVPFDSSLKYLNSVSFLIYTCGDIDTLGARLENANGSVFGGLPVDLEYCGETQYVFELEEQFERILCYVVTVDVSGYDLTDLFLTLQVNIKSVFGSWIYQYDRGFYFQCDSIYGTYDSFETPWYSIFGRWLNTQLGLLNANTVSVINEFQTSVSTWFSDLYDRIGWFRTAMEQYWDDFFERLKWFRSSMEQLLTDIYNALTASGDDDQFQDDVGQQGDKLDDMAGIMDSVTLPAFDSINVDPGAFVNQSDVQLLVSPIAVIYDVPIFKTILLMSIMMATAGYVLFGKR